MTSRTPTLLLIEDFLPDRELYRRYLCIFGDKPYRVLEAETAEAGLELCRTEAIDAILVDYLLPDANGLQFLASLHAQSNGNSPPVVMVTGEGDESVAVRAMKLGAEDYLTKRQLTPDLLQLTMRSAIENARLRLQLRQCDDRFRVSVENMLDCFGIFSAIRDESGQIIDFQIDYLNNAACENNQMPPEAQLGKRLCELLPAHRETGLFDEYCRVVESGKPLFKESLIYEDDYAGRRLLRAFDIHASKLDDGFVASWRDVTARKQAELDRQQQLERERILNQITQQIRRSLNLWEILNSAVTEVRQLLNTDRALVYRFNPDFSGRIITESVGEGWMPTLNTQIEDTYFIETQGKDFRQGRVSMVEDTATATLTECHTELLERFQVRANLVVPILQGEALWGLLVLHQCAHPRQWQASEVELLQQIAAQVGIAVQQSELYQQVQQKQQFIQQISDAAPGFLYIYDLIEQRNIYSNRGIVDILGYTPEEIQAMGAAVLPQLFHPDDFAQIPARIAQLQASQPGENFESEFRLRHANGEWRWFGARETAYRRNSAGVVYQILGVAQEISDRKRLEVALTESERRFRELFNTTYQFVGLLTPDGTLLEANQTALDFAGLTREEAIGRPFWDVRWWTISAETQHQLREAIARAAGGEFVRYEVEVLGIGATTTTIDFSLKPVCDELGRVVLLIPEGRDIRDRLRNEGDRRRMEAELQESETRYRMLTQLVPQILWTAQPDGYLDYFNQQWAEFAGVDPAETEGWNWQPVLHPEDQQKTVDLWTQATQAGKFYECEHRVRRADGEYRWLLSRALPQRDETGKITKWFGTATDIHATKELEIERMQLLAASEVARAEAEAANRSKDEFVSLVAHELRSPLNAVMGWAKLLQTRSFDAATTQKALETIARNTQAQAQLIEDLLDVSRMARGALRLTMTSVDLSAVVEAAIETVRPTAEAKELQLQTQLGKLKPISGDFQRLQQVVLNLLTNAMKFTPAGGQVQILLHQQDDHARIQVSDTGKGISPDFLPHIFEQFRQDGQNATAKQGLGLGLAIVKHLVEQHGGTITVQSEGEEQGATFTVLLPLVQWNDGLEHESVTPPAADYTAQSLAGMRVLFVDDDPDMLTLTALVLRQAGAIVQTAASAASALAQFAAFQPDILLSDIAMPGQTGYELLQQVRTLATGGRIPAIALTAYASEAHRADSLRAGFQQHLTKPVEPEVLIAEIVRLSRK
ncbi:MAG: PAS domain S-box protein [Leptolyngbyaceae cyanobacterium bins.349]|nr:PAS domain S-box protein [Leptolyngbyaceae cyanobacterium bins.349]